MDINYSQVVNQTVEEKFRMYMKHSKKELARMLANRDLLDLNRPVTPYITSWPAHGCLAPLVGDEGYFDDRSDVPEIK